MKKKIPAFKTDAAAEHFVEKADLSKYDLSGLRPARFEFEKKTAQLNMRLPKPLLCWRPSNGALKKKIPYTRLVREIIEQEIATPRR